MKKIITITIAIVVALVCAFNIGEYTHAGDEEEPQVTTQQETETTTKAMPQTTSAKQLQTTTKAKETTTKKKETKKKKTKKKKAKKKKVVKKKVVKKKIIKKKIKFSKKWKYAKYSKIHTGKAVLYKHNWGKNRKVVAVNAGHGTRGGERYKTRCHPNKTPKLVSGSTRAGARYSPSISSGTGLKGKSEAAATLSMAKILKKQLLKAGFDVLMIREKSDVQLDNIARTVIANKYADCHLAIHYDSSSSNKGAFFLSVPNIRSYRNMEPVKSHWKQHNKFGRCTIWGIRKTGNKVHGSGSMAMDLTQTSFSTIPSIDLEVGDKATSTSKKAQTKMAKGIKKGIKKYFKK